MFCSIVIPTIVRSTLSRAVASALGQSLSGEDYEIIVVNDSGGAIPYESWHDSPKVRIICTNRRERCHARNTGAAIARGEYLWFLDDDDWMLPSALEHFLKSARQHDDAVWICGGLRIVDEDGKILGESNSGLNGNCFAQIMGGAWAPIQSSIISSDAFFHVGGYNPFIVGTEDQDLCRRLALIGGFANVKAPVACLLRGQDWETSTNYMRAPNDTRQSRDDVLGQPGSFARTMASTNSPYWYGRMIRVCFSTIRLNLARKRLLTASSRTFFMLAIATLVWYRSLSGEFWAGLRADHVPGALHFLMKELEEQSAAN